MQLYIVNLTGSSKSYLGGTIVVPGSSSLAVTQLLYQSRLATDGQLRSDIMAALVQLSDGVNTFGANDALSYLASLALNIAPIYKDAEIDAFGRLRVSDTNLVESLHFSNTGHPLLINTSLSGSGTAAFNAATSSLRLTTTTSSSDSVIVQTKRYFRYNPGKGYLVTMSGNVGASKTNVRKRFGYFDADNGLFFQQDSSNFSVVIRTNTSGSPVDTVINQSAFNLDKLDGTGDSKITLDPTKHNLYVIDYLWHGAGRIRFGIFYNGRIIYCYEYNGGNVSATPYMRTPCLPMRAELTNTGTVASSTTADIVCFAFQAETSDELEAPYSFSASTGRSATNVGSTTLPIISIRPKATFNGLTNRIPIVPTNTCVVSNNQSVLVSLILNPTLVGASWTSADTNSAAEYDISATSISGGTVIKQFYVAAGSSLLSFVGSSAISAVRSIILGLDVSGSSQDIVAITALSTAGGTTVFGQIDWQEYQ